MPYFRLIELHNVIRKHQLLVIENDLYGFLSDSPEDTFSGLMPENSIYISSLSRAFLRGLRIAYVAAPANFTKNSHKVWLTACLQFHLFVPSLHQSAFVQGWQIWPLCKKDRQWRHECTSFKKNLLDTLTKATNHVCIHGSAFLGVSGG